MIQNIANDLVACFMVIPLHFPGAKNKIGAKVQ